ncbi:MAG: ABC transporter ATP-binding protein [Clostridia bacterium]|nr:ABC transporter ATP-binding protein [Clostridia bacterium]
MKLIKKFISYYKPHKKLFIIDMLCAFAAALCDLVYPMIARKITNEYIFLPENTAVRTIVVWASVLLVIYLLKALFSFVVQNWGHVMGARIQGDMRKDMFRHLQKLPVSFFDEHRTGTIMSRMINDLMDVSELAHHGPENVFLSTITLIGAFIVLSSINIYLTLIIFTVVPLMILYAVSTRRNMSAAFKRTREEMAEINAAVETSVSGIRVTRSYTNEVTENHNFDVRNTRFVKARSSAFKYMGVFHSGMTFFNDLMYLVGITAGGIFFVKGIIDGGDLVAYLLYITMLLKPINNFVTLFQQIQEGMTGLTRFNEIMIQLPEQEDKSAVALTNPKGHIRFSNVSFRYNNSDSAEGEAVIKNLSLEIPQGKTVALVGPSGGGKTTLCNLIPRFYDVTEGSISIDGTDIRNLTLDSLRKSVGTVAQDVFLFNGTIRENIAFGNPDASEEEIIDAAKKANIHDYIMTLEHGYDSYVGERGLKLSGGQKQRVSIARIFLKNPAILILDEATSALDNATEMLIQDGLARLAVGRTCLVVAHRLSTVKNADEIIVLDSTGVVERGTHDTLLASGGVYSELYKYQFKE